MSNAVSMRVSQIIPSFRVVIALSAMMFSMWAMVLGIGFVFTHYPPAYFADDWTWLAIILHGEGHPFSGSICRLYGHAIVLPNLHLLFNYYLLNGNALARSIVVATANVVGVLGIGALALHQLRCERLFRIAVLLCFASFGLWGVLNTKLTWSFGLTDALVTIGLVLTGYSMVRLEVADSQSTKFAWLTGMVASSAMATFSFGSGLAAWPAFGFMLLCSLKQRKIAGGYLVLGVLVISVAMFSLMPCERILFAVFDPLPIYKTVSLDVPNVLATAAATLGFFPAYVVVENGSLGSPEYIIFWIMLGIAMISLVMILLIRIVLRRENDIVIKALVGIAIAQIGAALLVGFARSEQYGIDVAYSPRYAALALPFWTAIFAIALRLLLRAGQPDRSVPLKSYGMILAAAVVVALSNTRWSQIFTYYSINYRLGALALLVAPRADSKNLKNYWGASEPVPEVIAKLGVERKGIFRSAIAEDMRLPGSHTPLDTKQDDLTCHGTAIHFAAYDDGENIGMNGWVLGPDGQSAERIQVYAASKLIGVGLPAAVDAQWGRERLTYAPTWKRLLMKKLKPIARAYDIHNGWLALAHSGPGSRIEDLQIVAVLNDGKRCEIPHSR